LAKFYHIPFSLITKQKLSTDIPLMISKYRQTVFTLNDGLSEWKGDGFICIAEYNNSLAGIMRLDESRQSWGLSSFIVNTDLRGLGIGTDMLQSLDYLTKPIYLKVKQDNHAVNLYLRSNFKVIETKNGRHNMKKWNY